MISRSTSFTNRPCQRGTRSSNAPSGPTGFSTARPSSRPTAASSSPKAGARWTRPEPSSVETKSAATTRSPSPSRGEHVERAVVAPADELAPEPGLGRRALRPASSRGRLGHDQVPAAIGRGQPHVADVGADGDGDVGEQGPRRRRPDEQVDVAVDDGEADEDRRIDHVAVDVGLAQLVRGQRRAAPGAVGRHPVALVEQPRLPHLPEQPPDRLDVVVVHRPVRVVRVDPDAGPLGQRHPVVDVPGDRLPAALVELGDAEGLDLVLGVQAELPLDLDLDGQAVAVPAALAGHPVALHGPEPGVEVLEDPGPDVVEAGAAVGGRRALVEDPRRPAGARRLHLTGEVGGPPALEHPRLERRADRARGRRGRRPWSQCRSG